MISHSIEWRAASRTATPSPLIDALEMETVQGAARRCGPGQRGVVTLVIQTNDTGFVFCNGVHCDVSFD